jgi:hypothetical protein
MGRTVGLYVAIVSAIGRVSAHPPFISLRDGLVAIGLFGVSIVLGAVIYPLLRIGFGLLFDERAHNNITAPRD